MSTAGELELLAIEVNDDTQTTADSHVYQIWNDGEITSQKAGDLLWQRSLHTMRQGLDMKGVVLRFPHSYGSKGYSFSYVTEEKALFLRAAIEKFLQERTVQTPTPVPVPAIQPAEVAARCDAIRSALADMMETTMSLPPLVAPSEVAPKAYVLILQEYDEAKTVLTIPAEKVTEQDHAMLQLLSSRTSHWSHGQLGRVVLSFHLLMGYDVPYDCGMEFEYSNAELDPIYNATRFQPRKGEWIGPSVEIDRNHVAIKLYSVYCTL